MASDHDVYPDHEERIAAHGAAVAYGGETGRRGLARRTYEAVYSYFVLKGIGWRPHDLRRTAATRLRAAGVSSDTIEAVLNHSPTRLVRHYQQPDMLPAMRDALVRLDAAIAAVVAT